MSLQFLVAFANKVSMELYRPGLQWKNSSIVHNINV